jgi:hypothetical protein
MKKLLTLIAAGAFAFIGTATEAEARHYESQGYNNAQSTVYVSGYHHGRPIYTQRYFVGHDRYGRPVFRYRTVSAPHYRSHQSYCAPSYRNTSYSRHHYDNRRHHSGTRVSFSFSR